MKTHFPPLSCLLLVWRQRDFHTWSRGWVGRVTPCAPFGRSLAGCGAHGVTSPTRLRSLFVTVLVGVVTLSTGPNLRAGERPPWTSNQVVGSPNPPAPYNVRRLFPKLSFLNPVDLALMPGGERWLLLQQDGKLLSFPNQQDVEIADTIFDFSKHHQPFDSAYSLAFHPKFPENGFLFVCYVEPEGQTNGSHVSRFTVRASNPPALDGSSEKIILRWFSGGHNGCTLAFGNDGFLYISTGDGSGPDPPDERFKTGQNINDLLACILRFDVERAEGTNAYAIPRDNPFVKTPGARPEAYAFGLRNVWRMSVDRATGDLWAGDVGWEQWEMIYRVKAGGNYGWSLIEGPNTHVRTDVTPGPGPILPWLVALPHSEAASVTGGRVYHGQNLPKLRGAYVYGDWETGKFWALRHQGERLVSNDELCHTTLKPVSFAEDSQGEVLVLDYNGGIYNLTPNTAPTSNLAFPRRLSQTGLFQALSTLTPAPGVVPYRINAGMWSDYTRAERLLGVPGKGVIVTADGRRVISGQMWDFPSNTVFSRTLTLELQRGQPSSSRRIETQLLHFDGKGWNPYTFRWNKAQTEADLVPAQGTNDLFTVTDAAAPGGRRDVPWRFAGRARTWLHVNCAGCHRFGAGGGVPATFNFDQPVEQTHAYDVKPVRGDFGIIAPRIIAPGDPDRSVILYRISTEGAGHMPYVGSRLVDEAGVQLMRDWIRSLPVTAGGDAELVAAQKLAGENAARIARAKGEPRREAIAALLATMNGCLALLDQGVDTALRKEAATFASTYTNALVRDLFQRLLPPAQRRQTLGLDFNPQTLLALQGNPTRGKELFLGAAQCALCHVCDGAGRAFGPDLSGVSRKYTAAQLLEQIVYPSRIIPPEYKTIILTLGDDTELSGFIVKRTPTELVLRDSALVDHQVKLSDVKTSRESALSAMPEGLLAPLTAQEAADLLEYLHAKRP